VPGNELGNAVKNATVLYEDRYFAVHPGVNPAALLRAAWSTYAGRQRAIGGSTLSMQLSRLLYKIETKTWRGKLVQILRALQLERHYGKDEILEAYLNLAPYGGNVEGIGTAALVYFGNMPRELSLPEALALAVIPQNPAARNPATPPGYRAMIAARTRLFSAWQNAYETSAETLGLFELPLAVRPPSALPFLAPHFARDFLASRANEADMSTSSLDLDMQ
jgi:penicillin-binding protein 1C